MGISLSEWKHTQSNEIEQSLSNTNISTNGDLNYESSDNSDLDIDQMEVDDEWRKKTITVNIFFYLEYFFIIFL